MYLLNVVYGVYGSLRQFTALEVVYGVYGSLRKFTALEVVYGVRKLLIDKVSFLRVKVSLYNAD